MRIESNRSDQPQRTETQAASRNATSREPTSAKAERNLASLIPTLAGAGSARVPWSAPPPSCQSGTAESAAPAPMSLEQQREQAMARVRAQAQSGLRLLNEVNGLNRKVPNITRSAEAAVGLVLASSFVGNVAFGATVAGRTGDASLMKRAIEDGAKAGGMIYGELCEKAKEAKADYATFTRQYAEFSATNHQLQQAMNAGDHRAIVELTNRMESQNAAMRATASRFEAKVKGVEKLNREFDQAAIHAAVELGLKAVTVGMGGVPGEGEVSHALGHAAGTVYGSAVESGYASVIGGIIHGVHGLRHPHEAARSSVTSRVADAMRDSR